MSNRRWNVPLKMHWPEKPLALVRQFSGVPVHDAAGKLMALFIPVQEQEEDRVYHHRMSMALKLARECCTNHNSTLTRTKKNERSRKSRHSEKTADLPEPV